MRGTGTDTKNAQYLLKTSTEKRTVPVLEPKWRYQKKNCIGSEVKGAHPYSPCAKARLCTSLTQVQLVRHSCQSNYK